MPSGPKTNKYFNKHAAAANDLKAARSIAEREERARAAEDAKWVETDAKVLKQKQKEAEAENRRLEAQRRKSEKEAQLREEIEELSTKPVKVVKRQEQKSVAKLVGGYEVERQRLGLGDIDELNAVRDEKKNASSPTSPAQDSTEGKVKKDDITLESKNKEIEFESFDTHEGDRRIGAHARVLYKKFCEENEKKVKQDFPGLRRSQLQTMLWERWQKSPENPFVQRAEARAAAGVASNKMWKVEPEEGEDNGEEEN